MKKLKGVSIDPFQFTSDEETLDEMAALAESGIIIGDFSPQAEGRPEPLGEAAAKPTEDLTVKGSSSESQVFTPPEHWQMLDVADVQHWKCFPLIPLVEGIIALGNLVLIAAPTQTWKTLLGLDMAAMLTREGELFGKFPVTGGCKVLYLALEDPDRRIKDRLLDIRSGIAGKELVPDKDRLIVHFASGLSLRDDYYFAYIENLIVEERFNVVFLDTYQKATPGLSSFKDEEQSRILHRLSDLTRKHEVTVIVLDHLRKELTQKARRTITIDDIKGTGGKAQNADVVILLESVGDHQMSFRSFSKDWDTPVQILVEVSRQGSGAPKFQYVSDLKTGGGGKHKKRMRVFDAIKPGEKVSNRELVERTGFSASSVRIYLGELIDEEFIAQGKKLKKTGQGKVTRYYLSEK